MSVYDIDRILDPAAPPEFEDHVGGAHFVPAPCQVACPVGTDAPSYIGYIWEGRYEQAFEAITATNPFSSICGRVCDAPCEPACRRTDSDGAVQIRNLKRYVMDQLGETWQPEAAPVTQGKTVGIVGAGPAGLVAAHDLCVSGYEVDVYEMSDRPGGMMVWGIPAFRLPPGIIDEDIERLHRRCPGLTMHYGTTLGKDISLDELKHRHDAVLLTIGAWWGKTMDVPGEADDRVVDGVSFLRDINNGARPELPETVVVVGGGDVAMDACRVAKRLPGCKRVKIVYRRGPDEIPARRIELHHAIKEGVELIYNTQQVGIEIRGNGLALKCLTTGLGEPEEDGRRRPVLVDGSEHNIECGMVIAAVGQQGECDELERLGLMDIDRVRTDWSSMRTGDPKVFAAGDGAFGGSTIVIAMGHGQRAAYYIDAYLQGRDDPLPYRTPYRTRAVPVAQDIMWERFPLQEPEFVGLGNKPTEFPEIELTYDRESAKAEAARCYRCDAETGSADYSVRHREDIFSMARTHPQDHAKLQAMLSRRLAMRDNPFVDDRDGTLDDIVFLPANLSRLVIDPYREACRIDYELGGKLRLEQPFTVSGFDAAPSEIFDSVCLALADVGAAYIGTREPIAEAAWLQVVKKDAPISTTAAGAIRRYADRQGHPKPQVREEQLTGLAVSCRSEVAGAVATALEENYDFLLVDATGDFQSLEHELSSAPDLAVLRDTIARLRDLNREEHVDIVYIGGVRTGTDAAKLVGLSANIVGHGVAAALAVGAEFKAQRMTYGAGLSVAERAENLANLLKANAGEASMMARCSGKTNLHNVEPEDLRAITRACSAATGIPMAGHRP